MPKVLNKRTASPAEAARAVYVGRPSPYGNPFIIGEHGTRSQVIAMYESWLKRTLSKKPDFLAPLKGKDLMCWCSPQACHADILLRHANPEETR